MDHRRLRICQDRHRYLEALVEPKEKRELIGAVEKPRSTVDRDVRLLDEAGAVERDAGRYRLTSFGRLVLESVSTTNELFAAICRAEAVVDAMPTAAMVPPELFVDATVIATEEHAPAEVIRETSARVVDATAVDALVPVVHPLSVDRICAALEADAEIDRFDLVFTSPVVSELIRSYETPFRTLIADDTARLFEVRSLPYGLFHLERSGESEVVVLAYESGSPAGAIVSSTEFAIEWAEETVDRFRSKGTELRGPER